MKCKLCVYVLFFLQFLLLYLIFLKHLTLHVLQVFWMTAAALSHLRTFLLMSHDRTAAGIGKKQTNNFLTQKPAAPFCLFEQPKSPIQREASKEHVIKS